MKNFEYVRATSLEQALGVLGSRTTGVKLLAGGTDLIVQLREGLRSAEVVLDVKRIPELSECRWDPSGSLRLGSAVPAYQLYGNAKICQAFSALTDSARIIGGWQIQSRASIGGNLCNSSPAADSIPALIALAAHAEIAGPEGRRTVPVEEFCTAPGKNQLRPNELLVALLLPAPLPCSGSRYLRFIPRNEMDIAVVGVGAAVRLDASGQRIERARVALGAVAPTPLFASDASSWLAGKPATDATYAEAAKLAQAIARPISDMRGPADYRAHLVGVLVRRALADAVARARGESVPDARAAAAAHSVPR